MTNATIENSVKPLIGKMYVNYDYTKPLDADLTSFLKELKVNNVSSDYTFATVSIVTPKELTIAGKKSNLIVSFCFDGSSYFKFNGIQSLEGMQCFSGYTLLGVKHTIEAIIKILNERISI